MLISDISPLFGVVLVYEYEYICMSLTLTINTNTAVITYVFLLDCGWWCGGGIELGRTGHSAHPSQGASDRRGTAD
jgi:hypothetical protein